MILYKILRTWQARSSQFWSRSASPCKSNSRALSLATLVERTKLPLKLEHATRSQLKSNAPSAHYRKQSKVSSCDATSHAWVSRIKVNNNTRHRIASRLLQSNVY
mmetsp:Transcript_1920/g.3413  ORF Transcript_1920/g.3413 Transcript_1920/m.3413 type:complete len:105 (-) Transcript_1920:206-520(-)